MSARNGLCALTIRGIDSFVSQFVAVFVAPSQGQLVLICTEYSSNEGSNFSAIQHPAFIEIVVS
jgi:hypothetical protein